MANSTPIRIDAELYEAASDAAGTMSRSIAQQVAHWARIGKELEASPEISVDAVAGVLRGAGDYDELGVEEQAMVRACWSERMGQLADALRLDRQFAARGRPYVELDDDGAVQRREPPAARRAKA